MSISPLLRATQSTLYLCRNLNCWSAGIRGKRRKIYERTYPTVLVLPNGSSININYHEPRKIILLPANPNDLSEEELQRRLDKRRARTKILVVKKFKDDFDESKYYKK